MQNYSEEDLIEIQTVFDFFDNDHDSYLSKKEIENALCALGYELTNNDKEKINGHKFSLDNLISLCEEFSINISDIPNKLNEAFQMFETDKKGIINIHAIKTLLQTASIPEKEINQILKETNPDAQGNFNYEAFTEELINSTKLYQTETQNNETSSY
jgi:Ca2+-binding EF-hand superfamily protein